jgi:hypothetical protein
VSYSVGLGMQGLIKNQISNSGQKNPYQFWLWIKIHLQTNILLLIYNNDNEGIIGDGFGPKSNQRVIRKVY